MAPDPQGLGRYRAQCARSPDINHALGTPNHHIYPCYILLQLNNAGESLIKNQDSRKQSGIFQIGENIMTKVFQPDTKESFSARLKDVRRMRTSLQSLAMQAIYNQGITGHSAWANRAICAVPAKIKNSFQAFIVHFSVNLKNSPDTADTSQYPVCTVKRAEKQDASKMALFVADLPSFESWQKARAVKPPVPFKPLNFKSLIKQADTLIETAFDPETMDQDDFTQAQRIALAFRSYLPDIEAGTIKPAVAIVGTRQDIPQSADTLAETLRTGTQG